MTKTLIAKRDTMIKYDQWKVFCKPKTKQVLFEKLLMYGLTCRSNVMNSTSSSWIDGVSVRRHSGLPPREKVSADDRWTLAKDVVIFGMKPQHQISVELSWVFVFVLRSSPFFSFFCSVSLTVSHFVSLFPFLFCRCVLISSSFSQADASQKEMHLFLKHDSLSI